MSLFRVRSRLNSQLSTLNPQPPTGPLPRQFSTTKNADVSTGPLARPFALFLVHLHRSLIRLLRPARFAYVLCCTQLLISITYSRAHVKLNEELSQNLAALNHRAFLQLCRCSFFSIGPRARSPAPVYISGRVNKSKQCSFVLFAGFSSLFRSFSLLFFFQSFYSFQYGDKEETRPDTRHKMRLVRV